MGATLSTLLFTIVPLATNIGIINDCIIVLSSVILTDLSRLVATNQRFGGPSSGLCGVPWHHILIEIICF